MEFRFDPIAIRVNLPTQQAALDAVAARLVAGRGFALATLNLDHLVKLAASGSFREAYACQDFVVADGNPIVWLARLAGQPVSLVPGSDLVLPLVRLAASMSAPVALVGSTGPALDAAALRLGQEAPGVRIVARIAPSFGFDPEGAEAGRILSELGASGARICLLALGAPRQEMLAARGRAVLPQMGFASIGAGLDFLSGHQLRAPFWVRRLALEWAWRLLSSPARLAPRYARCAVILPGQVVAALRQRWRRPG